MWVDTLKLTNNEKTHPKQTKKGEFEDVISSTEKGFLHVLPTCNISVH
jgi:hypothetical protein